MSKIQQAIQIISLSFMAGFTFSFCTSVTLGDLFFRKIKRYALFAVISGAVCSALWAFQNIYFGAIDGLPFYLLHTIAAFFLLTDKSFDSAISLICAEIFSASLIDSIQKAVFSVIKSSDMLPLLLYAAGYAISVVFILLLKRMVRGEEREPLGKLFIILLAGLLFFMDNHFSDKYSMSEYVPDVSPDAAIPLTLMLMSVTVLLLLSVKKQQADRFRELNELGEKYMTAQANHFEQSRDADTEMRMLRHDMKNHITVMQGLYDKGNMEELGNYLKELGSSYKEAQSVNITGNEIADAIITEKKKLAETSGIKLETDGSLKGLEINAVTLCTVLSDLLDNAIEAAALAEGEKTVSIETKRTGSFYYICISNPTKNNVAISEDMPTSKPDSAHHGLGLKSVRRAVEKCGGTLELHCKETASGYLFTAEVLLPAKADSPSEQ